MWLWARAVRADSVVCLIRLGHVAQSRLGLDALWADLHRRPGSVRAVLLCGDADDPDPLSSLPRDRQAHALPKHWQADAGVRDVVGVFFVLAVADHLVRQPAGRDWLVLEPDSRRMGRGGSDHHPVPLRAAIRVAVVARTQTRWTAPHRVGDFPDVHAHGGYLLVRGTELRARARPLLFQHLVRDCAARDRRAVALVLLPQLPSAAFAAGLRAADAAAIESGIGTWPLITTTMLCATPPWITSGQT